MEIQYSFSVLSENSCQGLSFFRTWSLHAFYMNIECWQWTLYQLYQVCARVCLCVTHLATSRALGVECSLHLLQSVHSCHILLSGRRQVVLLTKQDTLVPLAVKVVVSVHRDRQTLTSSMRCTWDEKDVPHYNKRHCTLTVVSQARPLPTLRTWERVWSGSLEGFSLAKIQGTCTVMTSQCITATQSWDFEIVHTKKWC